MVGDLVIFREAYKQKQAVNETNLGAYQPVTLDIGLSMKIEVAELRQSHMLLPQ
jgi:hypothetical protein